MVDRGESEGALAGAGASHGAFERIALEFDDDEEIRPFVDAIGTSLSSGEFSSLSSLQIARAVRALWMAFQSYVDTQRPSIHVDTLEDESLARGAELANAYVAAVVPDLEYLVDTFTEILAKAGYHTNFLVHPLMSNRSLGQFGIPEGPGAVSFLYAELDENVTAEALDRLRGELNDAYAQLATYQETSPQIRERLRELCASLSAMSYVGSEVIVSSLGLATFLPIAYARRDDEEIRESMGWGIDELEAVRARTVCHEETIYHNDALTLTIGVVPTRSPIIRRSMSRYLRFTSMDGSIEHVFFGQFVPLGLPRSIEEIPSLRRKLHHVIERLGLSEASYAFRSAQSFVSQLAVDELFSVTDAELETLVVSALSVEEVPRVRVVVTGGSAVVAHQLVRVFLMVPAMRYSEDFLTTAMEMVAAAFGASQVEKVNVTTSPRRSVVSLLVGEGDLAVGSVERAALEDSIDHVSLPWDEGLRLALLAQLGQHRGQELFQRFHRSFEASFADDFPPAQGARDIAAFDRMLKEDRMLDVVLESSAESSRKEGAIRLHILKRGKWMMLSEILPVVEHFGFRVIDELPYAFDLVGDEAWVFDLGLNPADDTIPSIEPEALGRIRDAMIAVWLGESEDDILNCLVVATRLRHREVELLRALAAYARFATLGFSEPYIRQALVDNPVVAVALVDLFIGRFRQGGEDTSARLSEEIAKVASLDQDKILRILGAIVTSIVRTNFFDPQRPALCFKLSPTEATGMPKPLPRFEIYVRSLTMEGVHLRGGPVARGGIRWSDRTEDFRTEILGLMKAQGVKNSVIVPVGAKGGFIVRDLPRAREDIPIKVRQCYQEFIDALFSVTDNLVGGKIVHPPQVEILDDDDPYLVVAADKGTATFSDLANSIAVEHEFWLGDAFASGGSAGYDHKKMGITARGAWKSVEHHFGALGLDPAKDPITVVGIGDMSGDVFGNGMLLSSSMLVVGAFDHRHIFLDPNPDPIRSFEERKRLFELPRSSWADYDPSLLSHGGGIYPRDAKIISISPEVAARFSLRATQVEPSQLIRAMLCSPVDLLWNGGVGTFVKASTESNLDVSDKANDLIRVDANDLQARVVGEGGNLGLTQAARAEFAQGGGRCNSDAIDNSAGVDTSDHEVNLKILLHLEEVAGRLERVARDQLLAACETDVAHQVLADNVAQNWVLSLAQASLPSSSTAIVRLTEHLQRTADLDTEVEQIPSPAEMTRRFAADGELYRSELAVLLAYAKIHLYSELLESPVLSQPMCEKYYLSYFPERIRNAVAPQSLREHPLRNEITATQIANLLVNTVGITAIFELSELASVSADRAAAALLAALELIDGPRWHLQLLESDHAPQGERVRLIGRLAATASRLARWMITSLPLEMTASEAVDVFEAPIHDLASCIEDLLDEAGIARLEGEVEPLTALGLTPECARYFGSIEILASLPSVIFTANAVDGATPTLAAKLYFAIGARISLPVLRSALGGVAALGYWEESARELLFVSINDTQAVLARSALRYVADRLSATKEHSLEVSQLLGEWFENNEEMLSRMNRAITTLEEDSNPSISQLHVIIGEIALLVRAVRDEPSGSSLNS
jgi:glutamate dehydrogenase